MKKISYLLLSSIFFYSCTTPSTNNVSTNPENNNFIKNNTLVNKPIDNNDPLVSKPNENKDPNTLVNKPIDNSDPLVSKPNENKDPNNLVNKPVDNSDPLVSKPTDNNDPLVSKPIDNSDPNNIINSSEQTIDPKKVSFTKNKGFSQINFNEGSYEVNLNVDLTEFSIFRVLANSNKQNTSSIDINVKIDKRYNNKFKLEQSDFINENNLTISIKGIKASSNLYIDIVANDFNNKILIQKELFNEQIKENKTINSSLFKNPNSTSSQQNTNNTSNSNNSNNNNNSGQNINSNTNINNISPEETPKPSPSNNGKKDK